MVKILLESTEMPFVLFDYHVRKYAKYAVSGPSQEKLQQVLKDFAQQQHIFIVFLEGNKFGTFSHKRALTAAQQTKLILLGQRCNLLSDRTRTPTQDSFLDWIDTLNM